MAGLTVGLQIDAPDTQKWSRQRQTDIHKERLRVFTGRMSIHIYFSQKGSVVTLNHIPPSYFHFIPEP